MTFFGAVGAMTMGSSALVKVFAQPRTVFLSHVTRLMNMEPVLARRKPSKANKKIDTLSTGARFGDDLPFHGGGAKDGDGRRLPPLLFGRLCAHGLHLLVEERVGEGRAIGEGRAMGGEGETGG